MKLLQLTPRRVVVRDDLIQRSMQTGNIDVCLTEWTAGTPKNILIEIEPLDIPRGETNIKGVIAHLLGALGKHYNSELYSLKQLDKPNSIEFEFKTAVSSENIEVMHTWEKTSTEVYLFELSIDALEGESGDAVYLYDGEDYNPRELVRVLQGKTFGEVKTLFDTIGVAYEVVTPITFAERINNGEDNYSNSYVISTYTCEVQRGTR